MSELELTPLPLDSRNNPPPSQRENQPESASVSLPPSGDAGEHLAAIQVEELAAVPVGGGAAPVAVKADPDAILTQDQFVKSFRGLFNVSSAMSGLKSLAVPEENRAANEAAIAIYDTAVDVRWLRFLIRPQAVWLERTAAILAFTVPMGKAVRDEIKARGPKDGKAAAAGGDPFAGFPKDVPKPA